MTVQEVADKLISLCQQGQFETAIKELYSENIVSVEPDGAPVKEVNGIENVLAKNAQFNNMVEEFHGLEITGPIVADNFFSCTMKMDVTMKGVGRNSMEEICIYKVENGKIVREEFFFTPAPMPHQA